MATSNENPLPETPAADTFEFVESALSGYFTENLGQLENDDVRFYTPSGSAAFMDDSVFIYSARNSTSEHITTNAIRLTFQDANRVAPKGRDSAPWQTNYLKGNSSPWQTGIRNFQTLVYENIWDGIDLVYTTENSSLKYSYIVHPHADISQISVKLEGHDSLAVAEDGTLAIGTGLGPGSELIDSGLDVYYDSDRRRLDADFVVTGTDSYSFEVSGRDPARTVIIDPFVYSTFLGGDGSEHATAVALDSEGNAYVTGYTDSLEFAAIPGTYETVGREHHDVYVSKVSYSGRTLIFTSFIGGEDYDAGNALAVDATGCAYVTGVTFSADFPTTMSVFDRIYNGTGDAFALKLSQDGKSLVYSGFLGGTHDESGNGIAVDGEGCAYITGETWSADFPATAGAYANRSNGDSEAFITKISAYGDVLAYSTFLGGSGSDFATCVAVLNGNAVIGGITRSWNFPVLDGSLNRTAWPGDNVFVARISPHGDSLNYSACLGGSGDDTVKSVALDSTGNIYIAGQTDSENYQITAGAFDRTFNGMTDAFVTKLKASGGLDYSSFIGGNFSDSANSLAIDVDGRAHITGSTDSENFPATLGAFDLYFNGMNDTFIVKLSPAGSNAVYSSYLGGSGQDYGCGIALEANGNLCIVGETSSRDFHVTGNALAIEKGGSSDTFVCKMDIILPVAIAGPDRAVNESNMIHFNGTASSDNAGIANYSWAFFDGLQNITLFGPTPAHIFRVPGSYSVILTVKDSVGNTARDSAALRILVYPYPVAEAGPDMFTGQGGTLQFDGSDSRDNVLVTSYLWTFGDGTNNISITGATPEWTFTQSGSYRVVLTVRDIDGNSDSDIFNVTVSDAVPPTAAPGPNLAVISGGNISFSSDGSTDNVGIAGRSWAFMYNGTQVILNGTNATFRFWTPGIYTVTMTVADAAGNNDTEYLAVTVSLPEPEPKSNTLNNAGILLLAIAVIFLLATFLTGRPKFKIPQDEPEPAGQAPERGGEH